ncbi:MAG TPA: EamA family transporter [Alphaproteobacteria bacterium]|jgi:drug/metabolite transporter (DMT)-like permease
MTPDAAISTASSAKPAAIRRATLVGSGAIGLWSTLALGTTLTGAVPPFLMVGLTFSVAALLMVAKWIAAGEPVFRKLVWPARVWALGVYGLFGYHALYFLALKTAPAVEANLVNYLWPLLIVLFSALLPGERLRWFHVAGAALGLAGAAILTLARGGLALSSDFALGYAAALGCALVWSSYSVLSRRFGEVPSDSVGGFCAATAVLGFAAHFAFETAAWPEGWQWAAVALLGLGPVGLAFYLWDHGMKRGDIRALGALSYATPLLSTVLLILFGGGELTWRVAAAAALIVGGAILAAGDLWRGRRA